MSILSSRLCMLRDCWVSSAIIGSFSTRTLKISLPSSFILSFVTVLLHSSSYPQYSRYGDHGYEMINITYSGETLIATKVTGDRNVPKGEVTFTVDLAPQILSSYASSSSSSSSSSSLSNDMFRSDNALKNCAARSAPSSSGGWSLM